MCVSCLLFCFFVSSFVKLVEEKDQSPFNECSQMKFSRKFIPSFFDKLVIRVKSIAFVNSRVLIG